MYVHFFHLTNSYMNEKVRVNIIFLTHVDPLSLLFYTHKLYKYKHYLTYITQHKTFY